MDNLNEKYYVSKKLFCDFINKLCNKRGLNNQISDDFSDFQIIKILNKILLALKLKKMSIGINVLDEQIQNLITLDKKKLTDIDLRKLFIYFYFFNSINELLEVPEILDDDKIIWQFIKQIINDVDLDKRYTYIDGEIFLNK